MYSRFDYIILQAFVLLGILSCGKCTSNDAVFRKMKGKYLPNYVFKTLKTKSELHCSSYCSRDGSCVSVNFKTSGKDSGLCELNSRAMVQNEEQNDNPEYDYLGIITRDCNDKGEFFSKETKKCESYPSCKDLLAKNGSLSNGIYNLVVKDSLEKYPVYCHMTEIPGCGQGGWTLVMKIDGNESDFKYESPYWTNKDTYAVENGLEGLTEKQTKLASYWNTPFSKICLGMKVNGVTKWIEIDHQSSSLFDVVADGTTTRTFVGRSTWKSLIAGSSLQTNCNAEGFNLKCDASDVYTHVRIGIVANNEADCNTCDSYIGFGVSYYGCSVQSTLSGNLAVCSVTSHYDTDTSIEAFGYILVQ